MRTHCRHAHARRRCVAKPGAGKEVSQAGVRCGTQAIMRSGRTAKARGEQIMTQGQILFTVQNLVKRYGDVIALNDVTFSITEGITGILGENGAGKSTMIKILLGLTEATSGSATILGESAHDTITVRARVGYMPEHDCLPTQHSAA